MANIQIADPRVWILHKEVIDSPRDIVVVEWDEKKTISAIAKAIRDWEQANDEIASPDSAAQAVYEALALNTPKSEEGEYYLD